MGFFSKSKLEKANKNKDLAGLMSLMNDPDSNIAVSARLSFIKTAGGRSDLSDRQHKLLKRFTESSHEDIRMASLRLMLGRHDMEDLSRVAAIMEGADAERLAGAVLDYIYRCMHNDDADKESLHKAFAKPETFSDLIHNDLDGRPAGDPRVVRALEFVAFFNLWNNEKLVASALEAFDKAKEDPSADLPDHVLRMVTASKGPEVVPELLDYLRASALDEDRRAKVSKYISQFGGEAMDALLVEFDAYIGRADSQDQSATEYEDDDYLTSVATLNLIVDLAPVGHKRATKLLGDIVADTKFAKTGRHTKLARKGLERIRPLPI